MQEAQATQEPDVFTVEGARSKMNMPKELQAAYVRIVEAGMKLMFDPSTRGQTLAFMEKPGAPAEKLGQGIFSVMALLFKESNQTMPPQLIIPCGIELLLHASAVAKSGGMEFDKNTLAEAMAIMVERLAKHFKVAPQTGGAMNADPEDGSEPASHEKQEAPEVETKEDMGYEEGLVKGAMR